MARAFKKGQKVKFSVDMKTKTAWRTGTVTRLVPKGAVKGDARLTVKDADGKTYRPFPSQCK